MMPARDPQRLRPNSLRVACGWVAAVGCRGLLISMLEVDARPIPVLASGRRLLTPSPMPWWLGTAPALAAGVPPRGLRSARPISLRPLSLLACLCVACDAHEPSAAFRLLSLHVLSCGVPWRCVEFLSFATQLTRAAFGRIAAVASRGLLILRYYCLPISS